MIAKNAKEVSQPDIQQARLERRPLRQTEKRHLQGNATIAERAQVLAARSPAHGEPAIALERHTSRAGKDTINHAPNGHDDVANAAAGVLMLAAAGRPPIKINPDLLDRITLVPGTIGWKRKFGYF